MIASPAITAPLADAAATRGDPVTVTWTAPQDPDWFQASLGYSYSGGGSSVRDSLSASSRGHPARPTRSRPESTNWHVNLFGYLHGSFTGPADADSDMRVRISAAPVALQVGHGRPPTPGPILIRGGDMGDQYENFSVTRDGSPLSGAVVSIVDQRHGPASSSTNGFYSHALAIPLQPGDELAVRVEDGGDVVEGRAHDRGCSGGDLAGARCGGDPGEPTHHLLDSHRRIPTGSRRRSITSTAPAAPA